MRRQLEEAGSEGDGDEDEGAEESTIRAKMNRELRTWGLGACEISHLASPDVPPVFRGHKEQI